MGNGDFSDGFKLRLSKSSDASSGSLNFERVDDTRPQVISSSTWSSGQKIIMRVVYASGEQLHNFHRRKSCVWWTMQAWRRQPNNCRVIAQAQRLHDCCSRLTCIPAKKSAYRTRQGFCSQWAHGQQRVQRSHVREHHIARLGTSSFFDDQCLLLLTTVTRRVNWLFFDRGGTWTWRNDMLTGVENPFKLLEEASEHLMSLSLVRESHLKNLHFPFNLHGFTSVWLFGVSLN